MKALFHGDLLNFGTIIILIMIVGGILVALTMFADVVWSFRQRHADQQHERHDEGEHHLPKSA